MHGGFKDVPYMSPGEAYGRYLAVGIKRALDAGADSLPSTASAIQTGLASSLDLVNWKKEGYILKRDPSSPILKYNAALSWILRENGLYSPGELIQAGGRLLFGRISCLSESGVRIGSSA